MENQIQFLDSRENKPKSNKKILVILLVFISIIFFTAIGIKVFLDLRVAREKANSIMTQQKNINPADLQKSQQNYTKNYKSTASATFDNCMKNCQPVGSAACNNSCLTKEAVINKDMSACSAIDNSGDIGSKDSAKAGCQAEVAAATLDLNNCEKITYGSDAVKEFTRYSCYEDIAIAKKDTSICAKIPNNLLFKNIYQGCMKLNSSL